MRGDLDLTRAPEALPDNAGQHGRRLCAARTTFAARYGRHVSAGITPPEGTYGRLPAWWSREDWTAVEVPIAVHAHRDVCRAEHVEPATVVRVARAMAGYADHRTGRDCRPTNERLAADLQMSVRQAQRARAVLLRLRLVVEVVRGRSIMTRSERLAAWRRGSSHRRIAAEFALVSRRRRPQASRSPVERVTPPGAPLGALGNSPQRVVPHRPKDRKEDGAARRARPKGTARPPTLSQVRAQRLAAGVQARLPWLAGTSPRRFTILHRFAAHGWTPRDVQQAADQVLRARGWTVPDRIEHPAAYLAALLRDVDPADRPGALEEARLAEERTRRDWLWQTQHAGRECVHGYLAGDLPHPISGYLPCPMCRRNKVGASAARAGEDRVDPRRAHAGDPGDVLDA